MHALFKHKLVVGLVGLLAVGGAGGAYAATQSETGGRQQLLDDVARRLNVTPSQLRAAMQGALLDRLGQAVKAGALTQAQADRIKRRIEQGEFPGLGGGFGRPRLGRPGLGRPDFELPGLGPRRLEPREGGPGEPGFPRHGLLGTAAHYLGLSATALVGDLRSGKTLAQVAQARGRSVTGLEQAMVAAVKARLDRLVRSGWISEAQSQRRMSRLTAQIDQLVRRGRIEPAPGPAGGGPGPGGGVPGPGGGVPGQIGNPPSGRPLPPVA